MPKRKKETPQCDVSFPLAKTIKPKEPMVMKHRSGTNLQLILNRKKEIRKNLPSHFIILSESFACMPARLAVFQSGIPLRKDQDPLS